MGAFDLPRAKQDTAALDLAVASANAKSHTCPPRPGLLTPLPTVHVAHCIAGITNGNRPFYSRPITWEETWRSLSLWLTALRHQGIRSGVYAVLDSTNYPPKPRSALPNGTRPIDYLRHEHFDPETTQQLPKVQWNSMGAVHALRASAEHVEFAEFTPGVCTRVARLPVRRWNCSCSLAPATTPRFWEMLGKHAQCYAMLTRHEQASGVSYDFVTKLRPDANVAAEWWMRPAWMRAALEGLQIGSNTRPASSTILTSPSINGACHSWSDWFALIPRALARRYLDTTTQISCEWLECVRRQHGATAVLKPPGHCLYNEALHVQWLLDGHATVRTVPPPAQMTNASGWSCGGDHDEELPAWLRVLRSRVRGPGLDLLVQVRAAAEHAATLPPLHNRHGAPCG